MDGTNLPALFGTKFFYGRPAAFIQSILQALLLAVADDEAFRRYGAYQMMELGLNGSQIGKNVGVVEFQIVQNGGTRTVMYEFGAFVEKGGVVFVGFDNKKRRFAVRVLARRLRQAGGNAEVSGTPPMRKPGASPAYSKTHASMDAVVVLPCVPATPSTQ